MSAVYVTPEKMMEVFGGGASCFDCSKEAAEASDNEEGKKWVIYN